MKAVGLVSGFRAFRLLKGFTRTSRIQLGPGLRDALEWLEYEIVEATGEDVEVKLAEASTANLPDTYPAPPSWGVHDAWVEAGSVKLSLADHPTLASAHTPPSDGPIRARVVAVRDPLDASEYERARGAVALVEGGPWGLAYLLAAEAGAEAVAFYRRDLPSRAVPYTGLFLPAAELRRYGIPAVSLPRALAERLDGRDVTIYVDTDLSEAQKVPMLEASIPGRDECEGYIALVAHACHPEPGANDNASGVAAVAEAVTALAAAAESGAQPPCEVRAYWLPEYTGSILVARRTRPPRAVLNLDMVGGVRGSVGPTRLFMPPLPWASGASDAALRAFTLAYGAVQGVAPFTAGSDHVPFLHFGIEALMINQWPDRYYHSDMDDANRISRTALARAARAAVAFAAAKPAGSGRAADILTRMLVERHAARGDVESAALAASTGRLAAGLEPLAGDAGGSPVWEEWMRHSYPKLLGFPALSTVQVASRDLDAALRLARLMRGHGLLDALTVLLVEPQLLADGSRSAAYIAEIIAAEHGVRAAAGVPRSLMLLEEAGFLKL